MFVAYKNSNKKVFAIRVTEWQCRMTAKKIDLIAYNAWVATITSGDPPVVTYPSEDFTIVECTDENVQERLIELSDYISVPLPPKIKEYNIKYYVSKRDAEEILDTDGKSYDPKQYVQSHFVPDDTAKDKRLLDEEWVRIRKERTRLLGDTDHHALSDQTLSDDMKAYRKSLRDLPSDQSSKTKYSDITWPTKP